MLMGSGGLRNSFSSPADRATPAAVEARLLRLEDIYANSLITEAEYRLRRETILRYLLRPGTTSRRLVVNLDV